MAATVSTAVPLAQVLQTLTSVCFSFVLLFFPDVKQETQLCSQTLTLGLLKEILDEQVGKAHWNCFDQQLSEGRTLSNWL